MITLLVLLLCAPIAILMASYVKVLYDWSRKINVAEACNVRESGAATTNNLKKNSTSNETTTVKQVSQAPGPFPWPILGNLALLGKYSNPFIAFTDLSEQYGDAFSLTLGASRCIVLNSVELITEALSRNGKYFGDRPDFIRYHRLFGGDRNNSLALCDWSTLQQKRRNLARRHCSPRNTSDFFRKMSDVGVLEMHEFRHELQKQIGDGKEVYLKPILQATAANMFSQYMCSKRFDYEDVEFKNVVRRFDDIFWYINEGYAIDFLPWLSPFYTKHLNRVSNWSTDIRKFINEQIMDAREQNLQKDDEEQDFTDALLKSLAEDPMVTRDTIMYMLEDFLGGHSAIGNLAMIALTYVALYPEVGRCIQDEIDELLQNESRDITLFDREKLPYTMALMFETLRYSSSPIVPHVATEDVILASNYAITKGTTVFINNYKLNMSKSHWSDPEVFRPERFLEPTENGMDSNNNNETAEEGQGPKYTLRTNLPHFLPFSVGKRTCIGQNLVRSFGFLMIANIMRSYNVSSQAPEEIKLYEACVALPADTFPLTLSPRKGGVAKH